jgi:uncharacterized protein YbjT (DUF2867 family)
MMYCASIVVIALLQGSSAFVTTARPAVAFSLEAQRTHNDNDVRFGVDRRGVMANTVSSFAVLVGSSLFPDFASAEDVLPSESKIVVAGATGQTGRRILERLAAQPGNTVVGAVRSPDKASKSLSESSTVIRGAMVQKVGSIDTSGVELKHLDVEKDSVDEMADALSGATSLIIAVGFVPGNPFKMSEAAHAVDNVGTCKLIDAAKKAGTIKKIVLISSILTSAREWGQENSPGFVATNAFGQVLDEKLVAEKYLRASGIDYTIVRPGGLKAKPPAGGLIVSGENTLNSGEISRDLVADVCIAALTEPKASNKVLEIIEATEGGPKVFNGLQM